MSDYRGCRIIQCFIVQLNMVTVPHNMVGLERMLDYRDSAVYSIYMHVYMQYCTHDVCVCVCVCD